MTGLKPLEWIPLSDGALEVGDVVSADAGGMPVYRVVALAGRQAWLRGERQPADQLMPLNHFRWKAALRSAP